MSSRNRYHGSGCSGYLAQTVVGDLPALNGFGRYTGQPTVGVLGVAVQAVVLNGFGEETGWRGFAIPALLPRFGPLDAALVIAPVWASPFAMGFAPTCGAPRAHVAARQRLPETCPGRRYGRRKASVQRRRRAVSGDTRPAA